MRKISLRREPHSGHLFFSKYSLIFQKDFNVQVLDRIATKHHSEGTFFPGKKPDSTEGSLINLEEILCLWKSNKGFA